MNGRESKKLRRYLKYQASYLFNNFMAVVKQLSFGKE